MTSHVIDSALFRDQFGTEEIRQIFSDRRLIQCWLDVEAALARAEARASVIPEEAAREITEAARVDRIGRILQQHPALALDAMVQQHERDMSAWQAEWEFIPEVAILASGTLEQTRRIFTHLTVRPERMAANLQLTGGLINAEAVMMALAPHIGRQRAHELVGHAARMSFETGAALQVSQDANGGPQRLRGQVAVPAPEEETVEPLLSQGCDLCLQSGEILIVLPDVWMHGNLRAKRRDMPQLSLDRGEVKRIRVEDALGRFGDRLVLVGPGPELE